MIPDDEEKTELITEFALWRIHGFAGVAWREIGLSFGARWHGVNSPDYSIVSLYWQVLFLYGELSLVKF